MANRKDYAEAMPADDFDSRPRGNPRAWLTKRVMITEREPLYDDGNGKTIGQLVDAEIDRFNEGLKVYAPDQRQPEIHSVTVEFPVE